jgi:hypothetical protein
VTHSRTEVARRLATVVRSRALVTLAAVLAASASRAAAAQDYRVRMDASAQAVSFRGVRLDSIATALVVPGSTGLETPEGHAVRCSGSPYCFFFRPGPALRAIPISTSASLVVWGLGVEGLAAHATGRLVADLGDDVWPGTNPLAQLLEAYLEYQRASLRARAGRQLVASRLEPIGFDGGWLSARWNAASLEVAGYGGWGLGQASALPAPSPSLNPLDEWRPRDRQLVAGIEAAWMYAGLDLRAEYRREMDPRDGNFVSERTALSGASRLGNVLMTGGMDYNLAESRHGSADLTLTYVDPRFSVSGGARRYRPYFSLWTLWGAFSPVPYHAVFASGHVSATDWLSLRARGERYEYEEAEISTALVTGLQDGGWRTSAGATATLRRHWTVDGTGGVEFGPGASARFLEGSADYAPTAAYTIGVHAGVVERPLELRYYDAVSRWIGGRAQWQMSDQRRVWADASVVDDDRDRADASASSLASVRIRAGVSIAFGSGADRTPLPPGRRPPR